MSNNSTILNFKLFIKSFPYALILIAVALWLRFTLGYNYVSPEEANTLLASKQLFNGEGSAIGFIPAFLLGIGEIAGGHIGARIVASLFGLFAVWMFFSFSKSLVNDSLSALISTLLFSLSVPIIFLSKSAGSEIIALGFFTAFLALNHKKMISSSNSLLHNVSLSVLFVFSVLSDINILLFLPFFLLILLSKHRNLYIVPSFITVLLLTLFFVTTSSFGQISSLIAGSANQSGFQKMLVAVLQYTVVPFVLFATIWSEKFRFEIPKRNYLIFFGFSLLMVILIFIKGDLPSVYKISGLALIWLFPYSGLILKDFLFRQQNTRMAVWFILFATASFSFYQVMMLEKSYINQKKAIAEVKLSGLSGGQTFVGEELDALKYELYPLIKSNQFFAVRSQRYYLKHPQEERRIIEAALKGSFDFIVLNGLVNPEIGDRIRSSISVREFETLYSSEYQISTVRYPYSQGDFIINKLR